MTFLPPRKDIRDIVYGPIDRNKNSIDLESIKKDMKREFESGSVRDADDNKPKKIRRFPSGAVRSDDTGRICPHYISPYALKALGEHFMNASNDFGATNYYLGITPKDCLGSMLRHYLDLAIAIEENDKDAIREELKAYVANGIMALHQVEIDRKGLYKEVYEKTEIIELRKEESK